jgi:hypothetical protein
MNRDCKEGLRLRRRFDDELRKWGWFAACEKAIEINAPWTRKDPGVPAAGLGRRIDAVQNTFCVRFAHGTLPRVQ